MRAQALPGRRRRRDRPQRGGLIARRYIIDHPEDHHVERLLTLERPAGAPKLTKVLLDGCFLVVALACNADTYAAMKSLTGAHQNMGSRDYHRLVPRDQWALRIGQPLSYDEQVAFLDDRFPAPAGLSGANLRHGKSRVP